MTQETETREPDIDGMLVRFVSMIEESLDRHATRFEKAAEALIAALQSAPQAAGPRPPQARPQARAGAPSAPAQGQRGRGRSSYCACDCQCWRDFKATFAGKCCECIIDNKGRNVPCGCRSQAGEVMVKAGRYWEWQKGSPGQAAPAAVEEIDPDDLPF